jgi:recombination protein RecA
MAAEKREKGLAQTLDQSSVEKKKALELAIAQIEKAYGKNTIMKLGDVSRSRVEVIPTGALSLDLAIGVGGIPRGRIIEVYGPESGGKTTVTLHIIAEVQKLGGTAAFIDAEHALDPDYARKIGVDVDNLLVSQPNSGEEALEITETLVRSGAVDVVVIDSVAALVPKAELEGNMGDSQIGLQARLMSQALRKLTAVTGRSRCVVIFINQLREKVGISYGNPEVTTGGRALRFYSSLRLEIRRVESIKDKVEGEIGNRVKAKVVKNKVAAPFKQAEFDIIFGQGISQESCVLDLAVEYGIMNRSGAWYSYNDAKIAQGRDNARDYLKAHQDVLKEVELLVRSKVEEKLAKNDFVPEDIEDIDISSVDDYPEE